MAEDLMLYAAEFVMEEMEFGRKSLELLLQSLQDFH